MATIVNSSKSKQSSSLARLRCRRLLKGHFGKLTCAHWAADSCQLISTSHDQTMTFWDALGHFSSSSVLSATSKKSPSSPSNPHRLCRVPTYYNWTMSCAWSPSMTHIALTTTSNVTAVFAVPQRSDDRPPWITLNEDSWCRSVRWIDDTHLVTGDGQGSISIWNAHTSATHPLLRYNEGHTQDINVVRVCPADSNIILTASADHTVKVWDRRIGGSCQQTMIGHESDVKALNWFQRNAHTFVSGGADSTCRMWDLRCGTQVQCFQSHKVGLR
jgi:WD40 repeat protein